MGFAWTYVIFVLTAISLSTILVMLLSLDEVATIAPDSEYYLTLARREDVPRPFCFRPMVPWLVGRDIHNWKLVTMAALVAQGVAIALLTGDLRAVILLLALPGGARVSLRYPVLVDAPAMLVTIVAALTVGQLSPAWVVVWGIILAPYRETAPLWLAVYARSPWPLVGLPFALAALYWTFGRKPEVGRDNSFIRDPLQACLIHRKGNFFDWRMMLLPWGVLLPLALLGNGWEAAAIWALSCVPLLIVTDTARVQYWAAPALIPLALAAPIPEFAWPVLLALHVFNPYRGA